MGKSLPIVSFLGRRCPGAGNGPSLAGAPYQKSAYVLLATFSMARARDSATSQKYWDQPSIRPVSR